MRERKRGSWWRLWDETGSWILIIPQEFCEYPHPLEPTIFPTTDPYFAFPPSIEVDSISFTNESHSGRITQATNQLAQNISLIQLSSKFSLPIPAVLRLPQHHPLEFIQDPDDGDVDRIVSKSLNQLCCPLNASQHYFHHQLFLQS